MGEPRYLAAKLLDRTFRSSGYSNLMLDGGLNSENLSYEDKRLCTAIYYGVIERKITLDHIISGLSNISYGLPYRKAINHAFLVGAMINGMDSAIMDPLNRDMLGGVYATEALLGIDEYCAEYLGAYRDDLFGVQK